MNAKNQLLESLFPQIINHYAGIRNISLDESKDLFFKSNTYKKLVSDDNFYLQGIDFIVNNLENEYVFFN